MTGKRVFKIVHFIILAITTVTINSKTISLKPQKPLITPEEFITAIEQNNNEIIEKYFQQKSDVKIFISFRCIPYPDEPSGTDKTPLTAALLKGNLKLVKRLLELGVDPSQGIVHRWYPPGEDNCAESIQWPLDLAFAIPDRKKSNEMVLALLESGAELYNASHLTPLIDRDLFDYFIKLRPAVRKSTALIQLIKDAVDLDPMVEKSKYVIALNAPDIIPMSLEKGKYYISYLLNKEASLLPPGIIDKRYIDDKMLQLLIQKKFMPRTLGELYTLSNVAQNKSSFLEILTTNKAKLPALLYYSFQLKDEPFVRKLLETKLIDPAIEFSIANTQEIDPKEFATMEKKGLLSLAYTYLNNLDFIKYLIQTIKVPINQAFYNKKIQAISSLLTLAINDHKYDLANYLIDTGITVLPSDIELAKKQSLTYEQAKLQLDLITKMEQSMNQKNKR